MLHWQTRRLERGRLPGAFWKLATGSGDSLALSPFHGTSSSTAAAHRPPHHHLGIAGMSVRTKAASANLQLADLAVEGITTEIWQGGPGCARLPDQKLGFK